MRSITGYSDQAGWYGGADDTFHRHSFILIGLPVGGQIGILCRREGRRNSEGRFFSRLSPIGPSDAEVTLKRLGDPEGLSVRFEVLS